MAHRLTHRRLVGAFVAVFVGLFASLAFSSSASAHHPELSATTDRPCDDDSPWTTTVTARADADRDKDWRSRNRVQGVTSEWSDRTDDQVPYVVEVGPFDATTAQVTVVVDSQWFAKGGGAQSGAGTRQITVDRPDSTNCITEPGIPAASYDCATDTIAITGADDTASVDYTVTITDPATGEGDTWAVTITASPQPGYQFPPGTPTQWDFSGTVDCLVETTAAAPSLVCENDQLALAAPTSDEYDYSVTGDLGAAEGSAYSITVTATPADGYTFPSGVPTEWTFSGTVDCVDESQEPPPPTASTVAPGSSGTQPPTPATELPKTGPTSTSSLLAYASILVLTGATLLRVRRSGSVARADG